MKKRIKSESPIMSQILKEWVEFQEWRKEKNAKILDLIEERMKMKEPRSVYRKFLWWRWETTNSKSAFRDWSNEYSQRLKRASIGMIPGSVEAFFNWKTGGAKFMGELEPHHNFDGK